MSIFVCTSLKIKIKMNSNSGIVEMVKALIGVIIIKIIISRPVVKGWGYNFAWIQMEKKRFF